VKRGETSAMRTQGLSLEHPEVVQGPGALGLSPAERVAWAGRPLAVVLVLQLALSAVLVFVMAVRSPGNAPRRDSPSGGRSVLSGAPAAAIGARARHRVGVQ